MKYSDANAIVLLARLACGGRLDLAARVAISSLGVGAVLCSSRCFAQEHSGAPSHEEYQHASAQAAEYFSVIYQELGAEIRFSEILKSCTGVEEAEDLCAFVDSLAKERLTSLVFRATRADTLGTMSQVLIAYQSTISTLFGYRLGFGASWTLTCKHLPVWLRESLCERALQTVREFRKGVSVGGPIPDADTLRTSPGGGQQPEAEEPASRD